MENATSIIYQNEKWDLFSCEYEFEGRVFSIELYARNFAEAEERRQAIIKTLRRPMQIVSQTDALNNN